MREPFEPDATQIANWVSVLGDDVGPLQQAARRRLLGLGARAVPPLRIGAEAAHLQTRTRCRRLLRDMELRSIVARFSELRLDGVGCASSSEDLEGVVSEGGVSEGGGLEGGMLEGAVLAAQIVRTFVPEPRQLAAQLRREAAALRRDCAGRSLPVCARLLAERLHDRLGLQGCATEELDLDGVPADFRIDHVLIDRAWSQRTGAPIALSLIYLLVARWAGLSAAGVAMPDHFLVRLHGPRPLLLDPFHGGRIIPKADCARYLRARGYERVRDHLRDLADREVLIQYLRSLRRASAQRRVSVTCDTLGEALDLLEAR
ncbi:MAG: transglutaminase family protein [Planctomycetota bacterium]